jgi:hypothetical protein
MTSDVVVMQARVSSPEAHHYHHDARNASYRKCQGKCLNTINPAGGEKNKPLALQSFYSGQNELA